MDRKHSNCAALRAVLIFSTFVSYYITGYTAWYHRANPNLSLTERQKIANAAAILGNNIRSSFSISQNYSCAYREEY